MEKAVLISDYTFPEGHPSALRNALLSEMLYKLGYNVHVIGVEYGNNIGNRRGTYKKINYEILRFEDNNKFKNRLRKLIIGTNIVKKIKELEREERIDTIIVASHYFTFISPIYTYCKKENINLIASIVDWYDIQQFKYKFFDLDYYNHIFAINFLYKKIKNLIVISSYLEQHYKKYKCNILKIPSIVDLSDSKWSNITRRENEKLIITYAGSPSNKDYIKEIITSINELSLSEKEKLEFRIYGPNQLEIKKILDDNFIFTDELKKVIKIYGKIKSTEIPQKLQQSDFTILFRPNKRYANAGFSTKFTESLSAGIPIICNLTSDMGEYINDLDEAIIAADNSQYEIKKALNRALNLSKEQKKIMKEKAYIVAQENFDYRNYIENLEKYLRNI